MTVEFPRNGLPDPRRLARRRPVPGIARRADAVRSVSLVSGIWQSSTTTPPGVAPTKGTGSGRSPWTVYHLAAVAGITVQLEGGKSAGETVVLEGAEADGTLNRWTFSDIRPDSFTWTGLESRQGTDWWCNQRMLGTRRATRAAT